MLELVKIIHGLGGTCYYTGVSLRNQLLNSGDAEASEILVHGVSQEELQHIIEQGEFTVGKNSIKLIDGIKDLNELKDLTINSIFQNPITGAIYDPHNGMLDLHNKSIRISRGAIQNNPIKMVEACRTSSELGFTVHVETWFELYDQARLIKFVPNDQLRDEMIKILMSAKPSIVFKLLQETRILESLLPELAACENIIQSKRLGVKNVFEHVMYTLDAADLDISIRLTMLFHDIAKPQTLEIGEDGKIHFFRHEVLGSHIAKQYMRTWGFSKDEIHKVSSLVLYHMFDADPRLTDKAVRRLIKKVGKELIYDLLKVRIADRLGTPNHISMKKIKVLKKKIDKEIQNI